MVLSEVQSAAALVTGYLKNNEGSIDLPNRKIEQTIKPGSRADSTAEGDCGQDEAARLMSTPFSRHE